jgi:hypothetical protein
MAAEWDRVVELARISMENPAAAAVLHLHCPDSGDCEECRRLGGGDGPGCGWPCPTVLAIEKVAARPKPLSLGSPPCEEMHVHIGCHQRTGEDQ